MGASVKTTHWGWNGVVWITYGAGYVVKGNDKVESSKTTQVLRAHVVPVRNVTL